MPHNILKYLLIGLLFVSCAKEESRPDNIENSTDNLSSGWEVPISQLVLTHNGPDRIVSIDAPFFKPISKSNLSDNEIVFAYRYGDSIKIYPQNTVWGHEIINDRIADHFFAITFCPLTGSALAWDRTINGKVTEFGVSGHLFNDNLIPYDRNTNNYWSQMQLQSIKGNQAGNILRNEYLLMASAETIKLSFPQAMVLIDTTAHQCDSVCNAGKHATQNNSSKVNSSNSSNGDYFGIIRKNIVHDDEALLFGTHLFTDSITIYRTNYAGDDIIVIGNNKQKYISAFIINSSTEKTKFIAVQNMLPIAFTDSQGNNYDLTGFVLSGPLKGHQLNFPISYLAHGFAWDLFYQNNWEHY